MTMRLPAARHIGIAVSVLSFLVLYDDIVSANIIPQVLTCPRGDVQAVTFSPSGLYLAGGCSNGTIVLWDARSFDIDTVLDANQKVSSIAFSSDGNLLSCGGGARVRIWSTGSWSPAYQFREKQVSSTTFGEGISSIAFSSSGSYLAIAGYAMKVTLWDYSKELFARRLKGPSNSVSQVAYASDGSLVGACNDKGVVVWPVKDDFQSYDRVNLAFKIKSVAISPDGLLIAAGSCEGNVIVVDATTRRVAAVLVGHKNCVNDVAFDSDGRWMVSGDKDGRIILWDVAERDSIISLTAFPGEVNSLSLSPDNRYIAAGSKGAGVLVWDLASLGAIRADRKDSPGVTEEITVGDATPAVEEHMPTQSIVSVPTESRAKGGLIDGTAEGPVPNYPPILEGTARIEDASGDNILSPLEKGKLVILIRNIGQGIAYDLSSHVELASPAADLSIETAPVIPVLEPGNNMEIQVPLSAGLSITPGSTTLTINVAERNGFDLTPPITCKLLCGVDARPSLRVQSVFLRDQNGNGVVERSEVIAITVVIKNIGNGNASSVTVTPTAGANTFLSSDSRRQYDYDVIFPGAIKQLELTAFTNNRADALFVSLNRSDALGMSGNLLDLLIPIGQTTGDVKELEVDSASILHFEGVCLLESGIVKLRGLIVDLTGKVLPSGQYPVTFRFYPDSLGKPMLWEDESHVDIVDGSLNVQLAHVKPIDMDIFKRPNVWISIGVGSWGEVSHRIPVQVTSGSATEETEKAIPRNNRPSGPAVLDKTEPIPLPPASVGRGVKGKIFVGGYAGYTFGFGGAFYDEEEQFGDVTYKASFKPGVNLGGTFLYGVSDKFMVGGDMSIQSYVEQYSAGEDEDKTTYNKNSILFNGLYVLSHTDDGNALFLLFGAGAYQFPEYEFGSCAGIVYQTMIVGTVGLYGMARLHYIMIEHDAPKILSLSVGVLIPVGR